MYPDHDTGALSAATHAGDVGDERGFATEDGPLLLRCKLTEVLLGVGVHIFWLIHWWRAAVPMSGGGAAGIVAVLRTVVQMYRWGGTASK